MKQLRASYDERTQTITFSVPVVIKFSTQVTRNVVDDVIKQKQIERLKKMMYDQMLSSLNQTIDDGTIHRELMKSFNESWQQFERDILAYFDPQAVAIDTTATLVKEKQLGEGTKQLQSDSEIEELENVDFRDSGDSSASSDERS